MVILVYLALALVTGTLVGALFLSPTGNLGYRPMLSGYTIILFMMILYVALSAAVPIFFNDMISFFFPEYSGPERFLGTLLVNWLGIILFVGFYHLFSQHRRCDSAQVGARHRAPAYFPFAAYLLVVIGLVLKAMFVMRSGGLQVVLVTRSASVSQNLGLSQAQDATTLYFNFLSMIADAAACWLLLEAMRARKQVPFHVALMTITLAATFIITPKREVLLTSILAIIAGFSIYKRPLKLSMAPAFLFGAVLFSMATLFGRIFLPAYAAGVTVLNLARFDLVRSFIVRLLSADIAFFDATSAAIYGREAVIAKFGSLWSSFYRPNIEVFSYAIPRFIWPGKPESLVDVSTGILAIVEGTPLNRSQGGFGIGLIGTSWLYGGIVGLAVGMALLAFAAYFVDRFLVKMRDASAARIMTFAISATMLFHFYRQGTVGWVFINFFQTSAIFWLATLTIAYLVSARAMRLARSGGA